MTNFIARVLASSLVLLVVMTGMMGAQTPLGTEFRVNVKVELTQDTQRLAVARDGSFAVVWADLQGREIPYKPIIAVRFFDATGNPLSGDQYADADPGGQPFVMARPSGGFRVFWGGVEQGVVHLFQRNYTPLGVPDGETVNGLVPDRSMTITNVVSTPKDEIVISWLSDDEDPIERAKVLKISPTGSFLGDEITIGEDHENHLYIGDVGVDLQGNAVATWTGKCGSNREGHCDVFAQRVSASGAKLGPPIRVNTITKGLQEDVRVAVAPNGDFLTTWNHIPGFPGSSTVDVFAQRFSAVGEKLGKQFRVNTTTGFFQAYSSAASDPAGNYLVVWPKLEPENGRYGWNIYGRIFRHDGSRVAREFRVNTRNTFNEQPYPRAAFGGNGTFVVVWNANDGDFDGIYAQRFAASPGAEPCVIRGARVFCDTGRTGGEAEIEMIFGGRPDETLLAGDYDGDGRADLCAYYQGRFRCDLDHRGAPAEAAAKFGQAGDVPLMGDLDGNGRADFCVRRQERFLCDTGHNGGSAETGITFGEVSDLPLLGDLDGDGRDEPCVWRSGSFLCDTARNGGTAEVTVVFGQAGDIPLLGDFDGDGDDDPCVFRGGRFLCDTAHDGGAAEGELLFGQEGDRSLLTNLDGL